MGSCLTRTRTRRASLLGDEEATCMVCYSAGMTLDQVIDYQRRLGITDHVVWLGDTGFALAHTNEEREGGDLGSCALHRYLVEQAQRPYSPPGLYRVEPSSEHPSGWLFSLLV